MQIGIRRRAYVAAAAVAATISSAATANAATVDVVGGRTSVALDAATLGSAAGLTISGTSAEVIAPGDLPGSVAFPITPATTFRYDSDDFLGTFSGTIEHAGSVFFNDNAIEAGDFTIGFDADRAGDLGGQASGFYVRSNAGLEAILFDVAAPDALSTTASALRIDADLLVSPEFATILRDVGLATADLSGADVGDARVAGTAVPLPAPAALGLVGLGAIAFGKRVRRRLASQRV